MFCGDGPGACANAVKQKPADVTIIEANNALRFDRDKARGFRLDIAAGTAVRFEPGQTRSVRLIPFGGARVIHGFRGDVEGAL